MMSKSTKDHSPSFGPSEPDHRADRRVVVVLGMHRSGTSAITRALVDMGVELGKDLMPPVEGNNPTGFWEDMGIFRRSERLLGALGRNWQSVSLIEPWRWHSPEVLAARIDMIEYLRETFGDAPLWGFKDPRTCRLLPFWKPVLSELEARPLYLVVFRNPLSVAESLAKRDAIPEEQSHLLWLEHMVEAMCDSEGAPRLVVDYDRLMESPARELERIAQGFGFPRGKQDPALTTRYEKEFLRDELRHSRFEAKDLAGHPGVSRLVYQVSESLRTLALEPIVPDASPAQKAWHDARRELQDFAPFLSRFEAQSRETEEKARNLDELGAKLNDAHTDLETARRSYSVALAQLVQQRAESDALVGALTSSKNEIEGRFVETSRHLAERDQQVVALGVALVERDQQTAALNATLGERDQQVAALNATLGERDQQVAALNATLGERDQQVAALNATLGERDQQVASLQQRIAEQGATISGKDTALEGMRSELAAILASKSWRLTAPLRAVRRLLATGSRRSLRGSISALARRAYRGLPVSMRAKMRLKSLVFTLLGPLLSSTGAYRRWLAFEGRAPQPPAIPAPPPPLPPGSDAGGIYLQEDAARFVPLAENVRISTSIRLIAFYLPQFHPIPENDEWWGKGFTEWTNVTRARPQFVGHYQPRLPGELGFYDLRLKEVQARQIELARAHGIHGFIYHYYWFAGKRLLERPLNQVLANPDLDFPFCVCWANENWTRRWDGLDSEVLMAQTHSPENDLAFIRDLEPALRDPRYIRVAGKPLVVVYRPGLLPDAKATAERWRSYCRDAGIGDLLLCSTYAFENADPRSFGFDAAIEFPPNNQAPRVITGEVRLLNPGFSGMVCDYRELVEHSRTWSRTPFKLFPGVAPSWDNEARRPGRGVIFAHSSPEAYAEWLENACRRARDTLESGEQLVFVNAWNEWAEGAYLEPDRRHGYAYLQATADVLRKFPEAGRRRIVYVSHDAYFHGAQMLSLHIVKALHERFGYEVDVILLGPGPLAPEFARYARVHELWPGGSSWAQRGEIVAGLRREGARAAIASTSVVGDAVEMLKGAGFRVVTLVHELPQLIRAKGLERSLRKVAQLSDRVVFPAHLVHDRLSELARFDPERTRIRPQGLFHHNAYRKDVTGARRSVREEFGLPPDAEIVLAMAYGDRRKGLDLFVEAALACRQRAGTYFVWIGSLEPDTYAPLEGKISAGAAGSRILFPGERKPAEAYFAAADVYLLPSREDPFPSVALAAMDAGVPVVGFEGAGGFCEMLEQGAGVLVPYEDAAAMARAVEGLLDQPARRREMGAAGQRLIDERFGFTDYVHFLLEEIGEPQPKVSVIVPNYNYERYLAQRLSSILRQTVKPYEIIFLDDCSSDGSLSEAERMLAACGIEHRVVANESNQGTFRQWLKGLELARGDVVWIAEADDYCAENFLETLLRAFDDSEVRLAYCQSKQVDEDGRILAEGYFDYTRDVSPSKWLAPYTRPGTEEIQDTLFVKNTIPNSSAVLMHRPDPGTLRESLGAFRVAGDWLTYVHVLAQGKIHFCPEPLNFHRRHSQAATRKFGRDRLALLKEILSVQAHIAAHYPVPAAAREKRDAYLQELYEGFDLHRQGPKSFYEHPELKPLLAPGRSAVDAAA